MKEYFKFLHITPLLIFSVLTACNPAPPENSVKTPKELSQILLPKPKVLTPFTLSAAGEKAFGLENLNGKWSFIFFGYTNCPDICPTTLSLLSSVFKIIEEQSNDTVQGIFVSVDPERDSPQSLKKFVSYFHPNIIGVTGERNNLNSFTQQMMTTYTIHPPEYQSDPTNYLVSHSGIIFVVDPQGRLVGVFPPTLKAKFIATSFQMLSTIINENDSSS